MATPTPNWGIHRWDDTTPVAPLQDFFNTQADDLENALDGAAVGWYLQYATKAAMDAVPGTRVGQHATVYADSTAIKNGDYIWDGSAWVISRGLSAKPAAVLLGTFPATNVGIIEYAGVATCATVASGDANIPYPAAFPNGVISAQVQRLDFANYGLTVEVLNATQSLSQLNFRVYTGGSTVLANSSGIKYSWRVIGW